MIVTNFELNFDIDGNAKLIINLKDKPNLEQIKELKNHTENDKLLDVTIKKYREKRSLNANAYLWVLCQKIAEKLRTTKEEIYLKIVREVGQFEIVPIKAERAEYWIECWKSKGLGWHSEKLGSSKLDGYINTINYYGTSTYNTEEMSIVINYVVEEAKELGIETMTPDEINLLLAQIENEQ